MNVLARLASIQRAEQNMVATLATLDHWEKNPHLRMRMTTLSGEVDVTEHELNRLRKAIASGAGLIERINRWEAVI